MESENTSFSMPVAPAYGGSGGMGGFGGDWAWILLLLVLFGGAGFGGGGWGMDGIYPWMNQSNQISGGFRDQLINDNITGIRSSLGDISTQLCNGFNGTQMSVLHGVNGIESQLASCCCENRAAIADLKYTIATEACANRATSTANTQAILDKMCQQEIDALKAQNVALQNQVNMQNLAASQTAQTAQLIADNTAQTQYIVNRVAPYPVPAYVVANPITPAV